MKHYMQIRNASEATLGDALDILLETARADHQDFYDTEDLANAQRILIETGEYDFIWKQRRDQMTADELIAYAMARGSALGLPLNGRDDKEYVSVWELRDRTVTAQDRTGNPIASITAASLTRDDIVEAWEFAAEVTDLYHAARAAGQRWNNTGVRWDQDTAEFDAGVEAGYAEIAAEIAAENERGA